MALTIGEFMEKWSNGWLDLGGSESFKVDARKSEMKADLEEMMKGSVNMTLARLQPLSREQIDEMIKDFSLESTEAKEDGRDG